jgi:hypothetical protein
VLAPAGERLVEDPAPPGVDGLDHPVPLLGDRSGLDPPVMRGLTAADQAELLQPGQRPADLRVILLGQFGQLEDADRAAQVDVDEVGGQVRVEGDTGAVQDQRPEARPRGALEHPQPHVVVVVARVVSRGVATNVPRGEATSMYCHPVHYARNLCYDSVHNERITGGCS